MARPICTNCQWAVGSGFDAEFLMCRAPQGQDVGEMLAGNTKAVTKWKYCSIQRSDGRIIARLDKSCGKEGRWFIPKEAPDAR